MQSKFVSTVVVAGLGALGAAPSVASAQTLELDRISTEFDQSIYVTAPAGDFDRLFVVEQAGRIKILNLLTNTVTGTYLDISHLVSTNHNEQGLLGMAFHPDYAQNGRFFVTYTDNVGDCQVVEYKANPPSSNVANPSPTQVIFSQFQPFIPHNGGCLQFGPDGLLYYSPGDGGDADAAQDLSNTLGTVVRLDVDRPAPFIPPSNPFVGLPGHDAIWAYGLRQPWRFSFDRLTGEMYMADVGSSVREEINVQSAHSQGGENYGWPCYEGQQSAGTIGCPPVANTVVPIHEYDHNTGGAIIGGYVYRGSAIPGLQGTYIFGDFRGFGRAWSFRYVGGQVTEFQERTAELPIQAASFGEDAAGEMYLVNRNGNIYRIVCASSGCSVVPLCFGVGCPCGNDDPDAGCANSRGIGGRLAASGSSSVSSDNLVLTATSLPVNNNGLFYMGDRPVHNPFYDGIQCALGTTFRFLGSIQNSGSTGTMTYSGFVGDSGGLITPGSNWYFHCWHRDFPGSPCGTGANLTHLLAIAFAP